MTIPRCQAHLFVAVTQTSDNTIIEYKIPSVAYFQFGDTQWPHVDQVLNGYARLLAPGVGRGSSSSHNHDSNHHYQPTINNNHANYDTGSPATIAPTSKSSVDNLVSLSPSPVKEHTIPSAVNHTFNTEPKTSAPTSNNNNTNSTHSNRTHSNNTRTKVADIDNDDMYSRFLSPMEHFGSLIDHKPSNATETTTTGAPNNDDNDDKYGTATVAPSQDGNSVTFLVVDLSVFSSALLPRWIAAQSVDFCVLILSNTTSWHDRWRFWWSQQLPTGIAATLLDDEHAIVSSKNATTKYLAVTAHHGQELLELLTPTFFDQHTFANFGMDDVSPIQGQDLVIHICVWVILLVVLRWWICQQDVAQRLVSAAQVQQQQSAGIRVRAQDFGRGHVHSQSSMADDCPICLEALPPGTMVRILPCRHAYHDVCITSWLDQERQHVCPCCKLDLRPHVQEQNEARRAVLLPTRRGGAFWRFWRRRRHISTTDPGQLISSAAAAAAGGDLELTVTTDDPANSRGGAMV